jgi:DNA-binding CsgD family transcriptional regulator
MRRGVVALDALPAADQHRMATELDLPGDQFRGSLILFLGVTGHLQEAVTRGESADPQDIITGSWYRGLLYAYEQSGMPERADEPFRRACAIERARRDDFNLSATCLVYLQILLSYRTDDRVGRQAIADQGERAWQERRRGFPDFQAPTYGSLPLAFVEGHWEDIARLIASVPLGTLIERLGGGAHVWVFVGVAGMLARAQGDVAGAWRRVQEILPEGPTTDPGNTHFWGAQEMQRLAAALALDAGDWSLARNWLEAHDRWLMWSEAVLGRSEGQGLWAAYWRATGETEQAHACAERALAYASEPRQPLALIAAHRLLGELASEAGTFDVAMQHLDTSLALADACTAPYERALTLLALTQLRAITGDSDMARQCVNEVRTICVPLGATPTLARADALAARLDAAPSTTPSYPAGLSAREVEVLCLVAAGLSNPQVGERLFLSPRTVEQHLRSIFNKTGVSSRVAAARWAAEHDLV